MVSVRLLALGHTDLQLSNASMTQCEMKFSCKNVCPTLKGSDYFNLITKHRDSRYAEAPETSLHPAITVAATIVQSSTQLIT